MILLKSAILVKLAFWLVVIGIVALVTPQPAWPEWISRMVLSTGVALGMVTIGVKIFKK
jgi:hypothetical protein